MAYITLAKLFQSAKNVMNVTKTQKRNTFLGDSNWRPKNGGNESASYKAKHKKIIAHINRYNYPELSDQELHTIRVIAEALYQNIKTESDKSLKMYRSLDEAFVQNKQNTKS
jgi:hypothetical protein